MSLTRALIILSLVSTANAAETNDIQIGLAMLTESSPYKGKKNKTSLSPLLLFNYGDLSFDGEKLGYSLYKQQKISIDAILAPTLLGYKSSDSQTLAGMKKRKNDLSAGMEINYQAGLHQIGGKFTHDVLNQHKGYTLDLKYTTALPLSHNAILMPYIGVEYLSAKKSNYYYGVRKNEVSNNRASYNVGAVANPYIGIKTLYKINNKWSLLGKVDYKKLNKDISKSPIIDKNNQVSAAIGVLYSW